MTSWGPKKSTRPLPSKRVISPEGHAREVARFEKHSPIKARCWVDHDRACSDVAPPDRIGLAVADGITQELYQCPVCHSLLTRKEAFGAPS